MVALLNYMPYIVIAVGVAVAYNFWRRNGQNAIKQILATALITGVAIVVLQALTAGYIPKHKASNVGVPAPEFSETEKPIENRLRAPEMTPEERAKKLKEDTDWRNK